MQAAIAELDAQLSVLDSRIEKSERERDLLRTENGEAKSRLTSVEMERRAIEEEFKDVLSMNKEDEDMLAQIQELVIVNEALKKDEAEFKAACRKEHQEMMARNEELQRKVDSQGKDEENEVTEEDVDPGPQPPLLPCECSERPLPTEEAKCACRLEKVLPSSGRCRKK